jgi:dTDP-4-amino-4,6-dideoxygalactose transaminase
MVPMVDLKKQFQEIQDEVLNAITEVIESSHYILGPKVSNFEKKVAAYINAAEAIGVASGTDALHLALKALGVSEGDEVITTPFTFFATAEAVLYTGATPVFVDIDPETFNIDTRLIEERITKRTKAILPVHLFGQPADMERILELAKKYNLKVVEDCAQSFGAEFKGIKAGNFGDAGCFSFYPSKNLGAYGDGGLISLKDTDTAGEIRKLRNHGSKGSYIHEQVGFNSRLDEIQAAILLVKLSRIGEYNAQRRRLAALYSEALAGIVKCPVEKNGSYHVFNQYTIMSSRRDIIQKRLKDEGISSVVYYPVPLHLQEAVKFLNYHEGDFPASEKAAGEVLSLPLYPELDESVIHRIAGIIKTIM